MSSDKPVRYIDKTRDYYEAQGFETAYEWAKNSDTPFHTLGKPLSTSTVVTITTGATYVREESDVRFVDSADIGSLPERLYAEDLSWDKRATHLDDIGSYLPIEALVGKKKEGRIAKIAERFHCVPTEYSQRRTQEHDAPEVLLRCREDKADVALLVPL